MALIAPAAANAAGVPISTVPFDAEQPCALSYPAGGGHLALFWQQMSQDDGGELRWTNFGAFSYLNDLLPADGYPAVARPYTQTDVQAAKVGALSCAGPPGCEPTILAYTDFVDPPGEATIRAHRLFDGPEWDVALGGSAGGVLPRIVGDGSTGAILCWTVYLGPSFVRVQRLGGDGTPLWGANGISVASGAVNPDDPRVAPDGAGGAYFTWLDQRFAPDFSVYAMHRTSTGAPAPGWPASGRLIRTGPGRPASARALADGSGGLYIVWSEQEVSEGGSFYQLRIVRLGADGALLPGWPADGVAVAPHPGHRCDEWDLEPDGAGGVLVAFGVEFPSGNGHFVLRAFVQRVGPDGNQPAGWPSGGQEVATGPGSHLGAAVCGNAGAAIVAWADDRNAAASSNDIYAARFLADGSRAPGWPADGLAISTAPASEFDVVIGPDASDGTIIVWRAVDPNSGTAADLYGVVVNALGVLDVTRREAPQISWTLASGNPARGPMRLSLALPGATHVRVDVVDLSGRLVRRIADAELGAGRHGFEWDLRTGEGALARPGVYYVRARTGVGERTRTVIVER
jgi:hypothetical protein